MRGLSPPPSESAEELFGRKLQRRLTFLLLEKLNDRLEHRGSDSQPEVLAVMAAGNYPRNGGEIVEESPCGFFDVKDSRYRTLSSFLDALGGGRVSGEPTCGFVKKR